MATSNNECNVWGIHTQDDKLFLNGNKIALGWPAFGDLSKIEASAES